MGTKQFTRKPVTLFFTYDFAVHGGATGVINLGDLPTGMVIQEMIADCETPLVGGGSFTVGEDGSGGDVDGYFADLDAIAAATPVQGRGALLYTASANLVTDVGNKKPHKVVSTKDGFAITIASTAYTEGKIHFIVSGYQAY